MIRKGGVFVWGSPFHFLQDRVSLILLLVKMKSIVNVGLFRRERRVCA